MSINQALFWADRTGGVALESRRKPEKKTGEDLPYLKIMVALIHTGPVRARLACAERVLKQVLCRTPFSREITPPSCAIASPVGGLGEVRFRHRNGGVPQ